MSAVAVARVAVDRRHLQEALYEARLPMTLDEALQSPLLSKALHLSAEVIAKRSPSQDLRPRRRSAQVIDFKKILAGDIDD